MDGGEWKHPLVPCDAFTKGTVEYRPHISVLCNMLEEQSSVRDMYNKFVCVVAGGEKGESKDEEEKKGE